jgi:hypothetical protein
MRLQAHRRNLAPKSPSVISLRRLALAVRPDADRKRSELESELERELAAYKRSAQMGSWISSAFAARP